MWPALNFAADATTPTSSTASARSAATSPSLTVAFLPSAASASLAQWANACFSSYGDGSADEATAPTQLGPEATGTLTSPVFTIDTPYINFLVGGGSSPYDSSYPTAVVLNINGAIVRAASGSDSAVTLTPVTWDVSQYQGQTATVEFIDRDDNVRGTGTLAYILADEFRAADIATTTAQTALPPPWTAGRPLYASAVPGLENMNVAGFELCCRNYNTYGEHGFSAATGDFAQFKRRPLRLRNHRRRRRARLRQLRRRLARRQHRPSPARPTSRRHHRQPSV